MITDTFELEGVTIQANVDELNGVNLVWAKTKKGMICCGAFDVLALDKFKYPAVKMGSASGSPIVTAEDLLNAVVKQVNQSASDFGVKEGQTGKEALKAIS